MSKLKRVLAIHDLSCVGKCSLTEALPVISSAGIECSVLPTSILSTHTGGFKGYTFLDLTKEMNSTILFITHDIEEAILLSNRIYIISEKPAVIKGEIKINLPEERNENIVTSEEFIKIKKDIISVM